MFELSELDFLRRLKSSPLARQVIEEDEEKAESERQVKLNELSKLQAEHRKRTDDLNKKLSVVMEKGKAALAALDAANREAFPLQSQLAGQQGYFQTRRDVLERQIIELTPREITDFVDECDEAIRDVQSITPATVDGRIEFDVITERKVMKTYGTNVPSIERRLAALRTARTEALRLRFEAVEDLASEIQMLRDSIPSEIHFDSVKVNNG